MFLRFPKIHAIKEATHFAQVGMGDAITAITLVREPKKRSEHGDP